MTTSNSDFQPVALVAIDWADEKNDIAILPAGATKPEQLQVASTAEALTDWIASLRQRFGAGPIAVVLEQSRGGLIHCLMCHDCFVLYPINPKTLAKFREALQPSRAKDDLKDTLLLLEILAKHRDWLHPWKPDDVQTRTLALLVEGRREAVNERTRLGEQLLAVLKGYFPQAIELAGGNVTTRLACDLICRWPTLEAIRGAKTQTVRKFFYAHNARRMDQIEKRIQGLERAVALTTDGAVIAAGGRRAQLLARQILCLLPAIADYEEEISHLFQKHPDHAIFGELPGAGAALAPRLLVAFGNNRQRWGSAYEVECYSGIAPVIERSGKQCWTHFRFACPKFLRQSFHEFASCSIPFCPWAKTFYEAQIAKGKGHHVALRALAFKWIRILYRCWKDRCRYTESKLPRALALLPQPA